MRRAWALAAAAVLGAGAGLATASHAPASADGAVETGVWWAAQQAGNPLPLPPNVPEGGLWVEQVPTGPTAVSAVRFPVADGQMPATLTLTLNRAIEPAGSQVRACATTDAWAAAATPAPLADAPKADCGSFGIVGAPSSDGTKIVFDLAGLTATGGQASVVLLPGTPSVPVVGALPTDAFVANPVVPTFDVTFAKPGTDAVVLSGTATDTADAGTSSTFDDGAAPSFFADDSGLAGAYDDGSSTYSLPTTSYSFDAGSASSAPVAAAPALAPKPGAVAPAAARPAFAANAASSNRAVRDSARVAAGLAFLGLFAFGGMNAGGLAGAGAGGAPVGGVGDDTGGGRISLYDWPPARMPQRRRGALGGGDAPAGELGSGAAGRGELAAGPGAAASPTRVGKPPALR